MNKVAGSIVVCTIVISFRFAHADPPKIEMPKQPAEPVQAEETAPASEPISTAVNDEKNKGWKEYDNRIVKVHLRINKSWTVMEIKETRDVGSVSFTLVRAPGILVTFSVNRSPLDVPFEEWVSSASLTQLYPSGYKESRTVLAGRKATLIKGIAPDGRLDESYFSASGHFISQVSFTAPKDSWKEYQPAFADLKQSFRWLP